MRGFIIYPDYIIIEERAYVQLYGRLENGESFVTINHYQPYFYIKTDDLQYAHDLSTNYTEQKTDFTTKDDDPATKIIVNLPSDVAKLRKLFDAANIPTYEADIKFPYRYMIDHNLKGSITIEGDYEPAERVDRVYKEPAITPAPDYTPKNLRILSFDIESSKGEENDTLYCIGLACDKTKKVFINTLEPVDGAISCKNEEETIEHFLTEIRTLDPDIITGWNVIDFDLDYLNKKCKKYKIPFDIGRTPGKCNLKIESDFFRTSKADVLGRLVLDGLHLLRASFIKLADYKLNTAAQHILGDKKLISTTGIEKYKEIDLLWRKNKKKLVAYNLKDAELVVRILEKSNVVELAIHRSTLTGMPLDRVNASIASLDSLYIRAARARKKVVPSGSYTEKEHPITGGYVRESEPGIYDYVLVLDFKSFYPSIMKTFNIDPLSYVEDCTGKNLIHAPNGACFKNENGILPEIITTLSAAREKARKEKNELARYAIKIHLNSMFGVLGNPNCRFFNMQVVNAITHFCQYLIKHTAREVQKLGYTWIYSDTDSLFLLSGAKTLDDANTLGKHIEKHVNDYYKDFVKKEYNRDNYIELEYAKCYIKCIMPKLRKEDTGAKKRYAGLVMKNGKEAIEFTGLEAVRGDWTPLAKKFQNELLDKIFHDQEVASFIKKFVNDVKKGKYDTLLVYKKSIRKDLKAYVAITPPHVKAARQLDVLDSTIIEYVITEEGPEPVQKIKHPLDYDHYIQKQLKPIADSILTFYHKTFDDMLGGSTQVSLFDY